ncbi:hypothetical protein [Anaerocolumna sp.]|uniref:hypothetical protein n=1 Tax=Anaerocolumna sp. TaxID=2041569 RepID=UPI0028ADEBC2|nr:hypothetical protein [Anaerocolumna sp.]
MTKKKYIYDKTRRVVISIVISILFSLNHFEYINAEQITYIIGGTNNKYTYDELKNYYEINSISYLRSTITYQIEALKANLITDNYNNLNNQYLYSLQRISELNAVKTELNEYKNKLVSSKNVENGQDNNLMNSYSEIEDITIILGEIDKQIAAIDEELIQFEKNINTLQSSVADAKLQEDISSFYQTYQTALVNQSQNLLKHEFLKKCINMILSNEQIHYYNSYQTYLDLQYKTELIKNEYGLSTGVKINEIKLESLKNRNLLKKQENNFYMIKKYIENEAKISKYATLIFELPIYEKNYNIDQIFYNFLEKNTNYMQLINFENSYRNYLTNNLNLASDVYRQIELQIKDYSLQAQELKNSISAYVEEAILSYHNAFDVMEAAKLELQNKNDKYNIVKIKKNYKKATELELQQAAYEKDKAKVDYYQSYLEIVMWENIIECGIYKSI